VGDASVDPVAVDLDPLRRRVGLDSILAHERACGIPWYRRFVTVLVAVLGFAALMGAALGWSVEAGGPASVVGVFAAAYGVLAAAGFVTYVLGLARRAKLSAFAWSNDWAYADRLEHAGRPGSAFARVLRGRESGVVASDDPRLPFELGLHRSVARDRHEAATVQRPFAFIELPLPGRLPHIVLRNRRRGIVPSLGFGINNARMELEGDFASRFIVFAPEGYQQDALYIFTPDVMARVVDLAPAAEIELVGDRLYVYLPASTRFDRPATMTAVLLAADELHRRFAARAERYRDDRADPGTGVQIGLRGQRLAGGGVSLLAVAAPVAVLLLAGAVTAFSLFGVPLLAGG